MLYGSSQFRESPDSPVTQQAAERAVPLVQSCKAGTDFHAFQPFAVTRRQSMSLIHIFEKATASGIRCSAGHSAATHADFNKSKSAGLVHLTHYCNQMSPLHHREDVYKRQGLLKLPSYPPT